MERREFKWNKVLRFLGLVWLFLMQACGPGFQIGADTLVVPRLKLSVTSVANAIQSHECFIVLVSIVDQLDAVVTGIESSITLNVSSGSKVYNSLEGCRTYNAAFETNTSTISQKSPQATFYVRSGSADSVVVQAVPANSALGTLTETKAVDNSGFEIEFGPSGFVRRMIQDSSSGKYYVLGDFLTYGNTPTGGIARLNSDGSLDTSFSTQGTGFNAVVYDAVVQSNGKVVVVGDFSSYNGTALTQFARLNTDGSLDTSFLPTGTGLSAGDVYSVEQQTDGKFILAGEFSSYNGVTCRAVIRINADGSHDTSFAQTGTGLNNLAYAARIQADGKIVVGGFFLTYNGIAAPRVTRLNSDGTLDGSFIQTGTGLGVQIRNITLQSDGKILVSGSRFITYDGVSKPHLLRLNSDGTLDNSLSLAGVGLSPSANILTLVELADGHILVGGNFTDYNGTPAPYLLRMDADGSLDTDFVTLGSGFDGSVQRLEVQSDGKVLLGGSFQSYNGAARAHVARIFPNGELDDTFLPTGSGTAGDVSAIGVSTDGKVYVGGSFSAFGGKYKGNLARLLPNGEVDHTFSPVGTGLSSSVRTIALQPDGKIIVGGPHATYNGTAVGFLARIQTDGSLDTSFLPSGSGFSSVVESVHLQQDGKVLVGGQFIQYNGSTKWFFARINQDGTLDSDFPNASAGPNSVVYAIEVAHDGKILVGGSFATFGGATTPRIFRVNADGSLDASFTYTGSGLNGGVANILEQPDGKILVAGSFTSYNGIPAQRILRFNPDGTVDSSFSQTGTGLNANVRSLVVMPDGRIVATGSFTEYNGTPAPYVVRLLSDGSLDPQALAVGLAGGIGWTCAITPEYKLLVGGSFRAFNTNSITPIVRFNYLGEFD